MNRHSLFGTDGIRTRVGQSPLTPPELVTLGSAIGTWIQQKHSGASILIAHDTRHSAPLVKAALKAGLLQHPLTLFDAQVLPTPALFHQVMHGPYEYGIMITASHNPYHDNGIKIITKSTGKLAPEDERTITELYYDACTTLSYEDLGKDLADTQAQNRYLTALKALFPENFLAGITLVIDCAHGSYASLAPQFLQMFGARIITTGITPNGKNINENCGSLHPQQMQELVITTGAHAGFAFDGDGDRLVAIGRDGACKDGDELLAFLLQHPAYHNEPTVVGTILSNQGLAHHLARHGKKLERTPVGDKHVIERMKGIQSLVGGEPSGHLILRDFTDTSDGLFTLLRLCETALHTNDWNFISFTKFPHIMLNVPVAQRKDLSISPFTDIIAAQQTNLIDGRIVVRYSGTEPLLRIMVEAQNANTAHAISSLLSEQLTQALTKD